MRGRKISGFFICLMAAARLSAGADGGASFSAADLEFFEKSVRPALVANCFECHSARKTKGGLRLDSRAGVLKGGETGAVVVPGKPGESRLITALRYQDPDLQMPPKGRLPEELLNDIAKWIEKGLPWPEEAAPQTSGAKVESFDLEARRRAHWAWQPIAATAPPEVKRADWNEHAVDRFIDAKLEANGLKPGEEADRVTLIRRIYFDLIGLPPSPRAVENFLADRSPDAYEKVVDGLLASPRFGERWGRHWLDLVRYAESYGHEQDYLIFNAWRYRDYVIRAFNADVPYDQLVTEHIAGDLIEKPRRNPEEGFNESIIGTGFWHLGQATHGPVDSKQDQADRTDNQIDVMSKAFLGMTVACARCHDHKFDAISTKDYYALAGILMSSRQLNAPLDPGGRIGEACQTASRAWKEGNKLLGVAMKQAGEKGAEPVARYLEASREVMFGDWRPEDGESYLKPDIAFEDFDEGYDLWRVEGKAFGERPRKEGSSGTASSRGEDSGSTGTLTSKPFLIERRLVRFRWMGANDPEGLAIRMKVGDAVVRSSTPSGKEGFGDESWDVAEILGKAGTIEIVDANPGKQKFVSVDKIVFGEQASPSISRPIEKVARERGLDAEVLKKWVAALQTVDPKNTAHPMHAWVRLTSRRGAMDEGALGGPREALKSAIENRAKTANADAGIVVEEFDKDTFGDWTASGWAFGSGPTKAGQAAPALAGEEFTVPGVAHSGLVSTRLQGVLRSPTFKLEKPNLHYRVKGRSSRIRLVVDGFQLREFNGLLFESTLIDVNTGDDFVWVSQSGKDMPKFVGHEVYIELIDEGDGYLAVDKIVQSDGGPPTEAFDASTVALAGSASMTQLAGAYQGLVREAIIEWAEKGLATPGGSALAWLHRNRLVDLGMADAVLASVGGHIRKATAGMPEPMRVVASGEGTGEDKPVYLRGSHKTPGDMVPRRFMEAVAGANQPPISRGTGRIELAHRIFDPADPLPARVAVNRIWQHLFGEGIVRSVDNFGVLGTAPSHPELLDYLAERFRTEERWSMKRMIRYLVTSKAYRMTSKPTDAATEARDPQNALLHRANIKRMEGEILRDSLLAVSGRLNEKMFGPPVGITISPFMDGRNRPEPGPLDGDGRRSIYMSVRRNFLSPMMLTFDTPIPDTTIGRRTVSNVPAQSLVLMNDPFVIGQAELLAKRMMEKDGKDMPGKIRDIYLAAIGREPSGLEMFRALAFLRRQGVMYDPMGEAGPDDLKVWTDLCHVVFNLKEFIFVG